MTTTLATPPSLAPAPLPAGRDLLPPPRKRIVELDSLRGLAAMAVLIYHYTCGYQGFFGYTDRLPAFFFEYGQLGVQLFFMISGFVIFMTLENARCGMDFVVSRFSRLFPVFWAAVILTFSIVTLTSLPGRQVSLTTALGNMTMVPALLHLNYVDGAYWTLQIELFFYIAMLCLYSARLLPKMPWVAIVWVLLAMTVAFGTSHHVRWASNSVVGIGSNLLILSNANLFVLGMLFYRRKTLGRFTLLDCIAGVLAISYSFLFQTMPKIPALPQGLLLCAFVGIFYLLITNRLGLLSFRPIVFLGTISYSLYLIHQNVGYVVIRALSPVLHPNLCIPLAVVVSCLLATGLTFLVEKPSMAFIKKHYKSYKSKRDGKTGSPQAA